jgi:hypothetical protein
VSEDSQNPAAVQPDNDPEPVPPREPDLEECCGSGCEPCVFNRYADALDRNEAARAAWQARRGCQLTN